MADLAQAFSEVKSLPDHILQKEISSPSGSIPGWLALGEIHERKRIRATTGAKDPNKRPSMAEEYAGNIQNIYAGAGMAQPPTPPQAMPSQGGPSQVPSGGIAGLSPPPQAGIASMPQAQEPVGYARGGIVALRQAEKVLGTQEGQAALNDYLTTGGQNIDPASRAWCASFVNASLQKAGYKGTGSDLAKSFLNYGEGVDIANIQPGDIGVFNRGDPNSIYGHTGIVQNYDPDTGRVTLVAGNVGNSVSQQILDANQALAFRRPIDEVVGSDTIAPYQRALLNTIAGPESGGRYNVIYGGQTFDDYSRHPGIAVPIQTGPNASRTSSAAGRYQFLGSTWEDIAKRYNLPDFSPQSQDLGAYYLARENYAKQTGGDLDAVLQSGDPQALAGVGQALNKTWTSLPGGIEQGIGTDKFVNAYQTALNSSATAAAATGTAQASNVVATQAADTAGKMASAENALGGDPMSQYFLMQQLLGAGQQATPAPAPAMTGPIARPVDARQFVQNPFFMQRRSYG